MDSIDNTNKLNASGIDYGTIKLEWPFVINTVKHYIYRADFEPGKENKFEYIGKTADICEFTDKNAVPGKQYIYRVKYGNDEDIFTTPYPDTVFENAPIPPPTFTPGFNSVTLRWTNIDGAVRYNVYRMEPNGKSDEAKKFAYVGFCTFPVFTDNKVSANTKYIYHIKIGFSETLFKSWIENTTVETLPTPDQPRFTNVRFNSVTFEWTHIDGTVKYNIYRREPDSKDSALKEFNFVKQVADTSLKDANLKQKTKYIYRIRNGDADNKFFQVYNDFEITTSMRPAIMDFKYDLGKLPYLDGAESQRIPRGKAIDFARVLGSYDIVSFDIFDTLVFRPFCNPSDLFMLVGYKLDINGFYEIRKNAEQKARELRLMQQGNREVKIADIYEIIEQETGLNVIDGISAEFETELDLCYANPYMKRVFDLLKHRGKRIIAISDMYFPKEMMYKLLKKCEYDGFEDIFISCDYSFNKSSGKLFEVAKHIIGEKNDRFIHVGDNTEADINGAKKVGFECRHYAPNNPRGNPYRATHMSRLIQSVYAGLVNNHLYNGYKEFSPYYEYGFIYGGIYVLGFCSWIHTYARNNKLNKILFLSREGDIYSKVYNMLFDDIPYEYFYWSRIPSIITSLEKNRQQFLRQFFDRKVNNIRLGEWFEFIGIGAIKRYFNDYSLHSANILSDENLKTVRKMIIDHWDEVVECYSSIEENMKEYLTGVLHNCTRVGVVDVGWYGSNVLPFRYLSEKKYNIGCKIDCLMAALADSDEKEMLAGHMDNDIAAYIFSPFQNKFLHDLHRHQNKGCNFLFFEMLTCASSPSFIWIKNNNFCFDFPEVENYNYNKEIHQGILGFAKIYSQTFTKYPYMLNISGDDAYRPFLMLIKELSLIKTYFGNYKFPKQLFATNGMNSDVETVSEIIKKVNL